MVSYDMGCLMVSLLWLIVLYKMECLSVSFWLMVLYDMKYLPVSLLWLMVLYDMKCLTVSFWLMVLYDMNISLYHFSD